MRSYVNVYKAVLKAVLRSVSTEAWTVCSTRAAAGSELANACRVGALRQGDNADGVGQNKRRHTTPQTLPPTGGRPVIEGHGRIATPMPLAVRKSRLFRMVEPEISFSCEDSRSHESLSRKAGEGSDEDSTHVGTPTPQ
jgi:hypothetical protein